MELWPSEPDPSNIALGELFNHPRFLDADRDEQRELMLASAMYRYAYEEQANFFTNYFPAFSTSSLRGKRVLDLGSFTGGRIVYWAEQYGFGEAKGIDLKPVYAEAGQLLAAVKGVTATFDTGVGEALPYDDDSIDVITSYDVLEHVRDVKRVLDECHRVLKPGGVLFAVFPQFYQPLEAHLGHVTLMPALHWLFSGRTLARAQQEILRERGAKAGWYARTDGPVLDRWEKLPTLNGITVSRFRRIVERNDGWRIMYSNRRPVLTDGQRSRRWYFRLLSLLLVVPARVPVLEEFFLGRICVALEKTAR